MNQTSSPTIVRRLLAFSSRHAVFILFTLGILFNAWMVWQLFDLSFDRPLPPDRVTAKQLRVNETQRVQLKARLDLYRQPDQKANLPPGVF